MKNKPLKVYGLSESVVAKLEELSLKKYGNTNISGFVRDVLLRLAEEPLDNTDIPKYSIKNTAKTRMELKLPPKTAAWLKHIAQSQHMTVNQVALSVLLEHIERHPVLLDGNAELLRASNYQLLMIGRNLNQIARRLNAGENVSINGAQIAELKRFIDIHTAEVNRLLQTHRRRRRG